MVVATQLLMGDAGLRHPNKHVQDGHLRGGNAFKLVAQRPKMERLKLNLANLALSSHNSVKAHKRGNFPHTILNASIDGVEVACLDCNEDFFASWLNQMTRGHAKTACNEMKKGHVEGVSKHPNAPGYDTWARTAKASLLTNNHPQSSQVGTLATQRCNHEGIEIKSFTTLDLDFMIPHLQQLWSERRLVLGGRSNPLKKQVDFIETLVMLARNSPELVPPDCGSMLNVPSCNVFLSGLRPVATRAELRHSLDNTFGVDFLREREFDPHASPAVHRAHVKSLLTALKHSFTFFHQSCLTHESSLAHCDSAAKSEFVGRIACPPEEDAVSDDCVYAEVRQCSACGNESRIFEYSRFHGPLGLLATSSRRGWVMGQCEEFSRLGFALLTSLGYEARYVLDFTDHVWIEVWLSDGKNSSWVHADPSEGVLDSPLMYEKGWGKSLTMIFAFTPWKVEHVTKTYTEDYAATVRRRGASEETLREILLEVNNRLQSEMPLEKWGYATTSGSKDRTLEEIELLSRFEAN
eukprot:TRINITY_DN43007_c0_g1_i1.p1 TRINITY_DN43007_c0_g1~~TRINITY_DN43007_c0_g1_i1.p1  ORF type:complete len:572 (+),score=75.10 TRINITY_DN43007_c0_g1_i1:151-1716(+)